MAIEVRDGVEGKVCSKCKKWRILLYYGKDKYAKDGYQHRCSICPAKICVKCNRSAKDFKDYGGHLDENFGKHKSHCKACHAEYNAIYPKTAHGQSRVTLAAEKRRI